MVFNSLAFCQTAESLCLDAGLMDEEILAATSWGNESEPLGGVEPLDGSTLFLTHLDLSCMI
jgi:hypothetical protein